MEQSSTSRVRTVAKGDALWESVQASTRFCGPFPFTLLASTIVLLGMLEDILQLDPFCIYL